MSCYKKKLLVVDDVPLNRILQANLFEDDYDVLEADNSQIALKLILKHREELAIVFWTL